MVAMEQSPVLPISLWCLQAAEHSGEWPKRPIVDVFPGGARPAIPSSASSTALPSLLLLSPNLNISSRMGSQLDPW